jgi:hypothetical protein
MDTTLCVLNLSDPNARLTPDLGPNAASKLQSIASPADMPQGGSLILYVVGHGLGNAFIRSDATILDEKEVATTIQSRRRSAPTLIVWDTCFARSFLNIDGAADWPKNFVHLFSCRSFERTWHDERPANGPAVTRFSTTLRDAVLDLHQKDPNFHWGALESKLKAAFQSGPDDNPDLRWAMQEPSIHPLTTALRPSHFRLGEFIGGTVPPPKVAPPGSEEPIAVEPAKLEGRFGKMFPDLEARGDCAPSPIDLGLPGGPMDGEAQAETSELFAVLTYFGQFMDHDITLSERSNLDTPQEPETLRNLRTPAFDLESLYGDGPVANPHFYDRSRPGKLLLGKAIGSDAEIDLPRNSQGTALIGDPRNDENLIIAQLHVAFIKFHNAMVDQASSIEDGVKDASQFEKARRLVRWHYQWLILHEFLPKIVSPQILSDAINNKIRLFHTDVPFIPVEFSAAAYRFGHSMVRPRYTINDAFRFALFSAEWGAPNDTHPSPRVDLRGGPIRFEERINWKNFVDTGVEVSEGEGTTRFANKIDTQLSGPLLKLPSSITHGDVPPERRSLAARNLTTGLSLKLPSGQDVAQKVKNILKRAKDILPETPVLTDSEVWGNEKATKFKDANPPLSAPLWYYVLREAELLESGERLGPVGGRIVAEVIVRLIDLDPSSFRRVKPDWKPQAQGRIDNEKFTFRDFFWIAGVDVE